MNKFDIVLDSDYHFNFKSPYNKKDKIIKEKQNETDIIDEIKILNNEKNKTENRIKKLNDTKCEIDDKIKIKKRELMLKIMKNQQNNKDIKGNKGELGEVEVIKKIYNLSKMSYI